MFSLRGTTHRVPGHGFAGCARQRLLEVLHERAGALGVELRFECDVTSETLGDADLVVAADGVNSRTRRLHEAHFRPSVDVRPNHFVWLGTTRPLDAMSFFFAESSDGVFVAHAYPHTPEQGTWIVEVDDATFTRAGLDGSTPDATVAHLERVFRDELAGHPLIANDSSFWRQFPVVRCERWVKDDRLVLLGDAKGTVHYSIGSGTKLAMEDAVTLHGALLAETAPADALGRYEAERSQALRALQDIGRGSMRWFEQYPLHWSMPTDQFVLAGVTRKTNETYATVGAKAPGLVRAATAALDPAGPEERPPVAAPLALGATTLPTRLVADGAAHGCTERVVLDPTAPDPPPATRDRVLVVAIDTDLDADAAAKVVRERVETPVLGPIGIRIAADTDEESTLATVAACVAAGAALVDVTGGGGATPAAQLFLADHVRHRFGVATLLDAGDLDAANTAIASGRADLVVLPPGGAR